MLVMKRAFPKLVVRCETIRVLAALELRRAVGGDTVQGGPTVTCKANCATDVVKPQAGG